MGLSQLWDIKTRREITHLASMAADGQCRARRRAGDDAAGGSGSAAAAAEPSPDSQPAAAAEDPAAAARDANGGRRSAGEDEPWGSGSGAAAAERNPDGWIDDGDEELPVDLVEKALVAVEAHKALTGPGQILQLMHGMPASFLPVHEHGIVPGLLKTPAGRETEGSMAI